MAAPWLASTTRQMHETRAVLPLHRAYGVCGSGIKFLRQELQGNRSRTSVPDFSTTQISTACSDSARRMAAVGHLRCGEAVA